MLEVDWKRWAAAGTVAGCVTAVALVVLWMAPGGTKEATGRGTARVSSSAKQYAVARQADKLWGLDRVWTLHLRLELEAWEALQPPRPRFPLGPVGPAGQPKEPRRPENGREGRGRREPEAGPPGPGTRFQYARGTLEFEGQVYREIGIRYKGNSSFMAAGESLKRSLKLDFNRFRAGQTFHGLTKLNLNNNAMDPSQMREALAYAVFRRAGLPAPQTAFARVYLSIPGKEERKYLGLYTVIEQVDSRFLRANFGTKKGLLLKPDLMLGLPYEGEEWAAYERRLKPKAEVDAADSQRLIALARLLETADDTTFREKIGAFLELDEILMFLAAEAALANMDSPLFTGHNYYLYLHPGSRRFWFIPWDLNEAFGGFFGAGSPDQQIDLSITRPFTDGNRFLQRLFALPEARAKFRESFEQLLMGAFSTGRLLEDMQTVKAAIQAAIAEDEQGDMRAFEVNFQDDTGARAADFASRAGPSSLGPPPGQPFRPAFPPARFPKPLLKPFITGRVASIKAQLAGVREGYIPHGRPFGPPPMAGGPVIPLAEGIMQEADTDRDAKLTAAELETALGRWFDDWAKGQSEGLRLEELAQGILRILPPPPDMARRPPGEPPPPPEEPEPRRDQPVEPGGSPRIGLPAAPRRQPGMPPAPNPVRALAERFVRAADTDRNGQLSRLEWLSWWKNRLTEWDKDKSGALEPPEVVEGLISFARPARPFGGPPPVR